MATKNWLILISLGTPKFTRVGMYNQSFLTEGPYKPHGHVWQVRWGVITLSNIEADYILKQYHRLDGWSHLSSPKWGTHIYLLWAEKLKTTFGLQKFHWSDGSVMISVETLGEYSI